MRSPSRCGVQLASGWYEYRSDFARRHFSDGWRQGRLEGALEVALDLAHDILLEIAGRHGAVRDELKARVAACEDLARLRTLGMDLAHAGDVEAVEALLARLPAGPEAG